jgi:rRNA maturation protein Nop10
MKPGPKRGPKPKPTYTIPEIFEKWVRREKCPRCGKLINFESPEAFDLHRDFCQVKPRPNQHTYKYPEKEERTEVLKENG